jgi:hypothetical protein
MVARFSLPWILILGAVCFFAGIMVQRYLVSVARTAEPLTYAERLTPALNLTDEQHKELLRILADEDQRVRTLLESDASETLRRSIQGIRTETEQRILDLLDSEQRARYKALLEAGAPSPEKEG